MSKQKQKKHKGRPGDSGPLTKVTLVLPSKITLEEQVMALQSARRVSTRCRIRREPGQRPILEAWCTPRQAIEFDNFARYVFEAQRRDEGYDMDEVRRYFEEETKGEPEDPFILPRDTQRLSIVAAATGMQMAALDHPAYRSDSEIRALAMEMCATAPQLWPEVTNDFDLYQSIFIPSLVMGYHMAIRQLALHSPEEQKQFVDVVIDDQFAGKGPQSLQIFAKLIRDRMKAWGVETLEQLYEKEAGK
jgi:hypothetical protein